MEIGILILFFIGFFILIKGAELLVRGASSLAQFFNISNWVIGIVIVGIGTSVPELAITISSVISGSNIGISTIIGSGIFNLLFILGVSALITPIVFKKEWVLRDLKWTFLATVIMYVFAYVTSVGGTAIGRIEGLILFILFVWWLRVVMRSGVLPESDTSINKNTITLVTAAIFILVGCLGVFVGGHWVILGAEYLATLFGISSALVGLTIVGIGTSFPEFVVSLTAIIKHNRGIAVGNIIGSTIFDVLGIAGIASMIRPLYFEYSFMIDGLFLISSIACVYYVVRKRMILSRFGGSVLVLLYLMYMFFLFVRAAL